MIFIDKIYTLMFNKILENLDKLWVWIKIFPHWTMERY